MCEKREPSCAVTERVFPIGWPELHTALSSQRHGEQSYYQRFRIQPSFLQRSHADGRNPHENSWVPGGKLSLAPRQADSPTTAGLSDFRLTVAGLSDYRDSAPSPWKSDSPPQPINRMNACVMWFRCCTFALWFRKLKFFVIMGLYSRPRPKSSPAIYPARGGGCCETFKNRTFVYAGLRPNCRAIAMLPARDGRCCET